MNDNRGKTPKVCVIVLCYGERAQYLREVLSAIESNQPNKILIVANDISENVCHEIMEKLAAHPELYEIHFSNENIGSSGGYSLGIQAAKNSGRYDYIWLLDDDNRPQAECLKNLLQALSKCKNPETSAVVAYRPRLPEMKSAEQGEVATWPRSASCAGFHLYNLFSFKKVKNNTSYNEVIPLLWSTYGGLLLPTKLLASVGNPYKDLFLYGDDFEWTSRITRNGGNIYLCPNAIVTDLSPTWNALGTSRSNLTRRIVELEPFRVYYELRNRVWIGRQFYPGHRFIYLINRTIYLLATLIVSTRFNKFDRFTLFRKAIRDGERGILVKSFDV